MSMFKEFRDFIARGNVVDLAVAVIIGGAFGKIVTSFVNDLIMPPIGLALGGVDFSQLKIVLQAADPTHKIAQVAISYGVFLNTIIQFVIIAAAVFLVVKAISAVHREVPADPEPTPSEALLAEIRDLLARRSSAGAP